MDDLIRFLRARLDDEDEIAQALPTLTWFVDDGVLYFAYRDTEGVDCGDHAEHIARHDPARVLSKNAAIRQTVRRLENALTRRLPEAMEVSAAHTILPLLALPYADHPDYQDAWRP